MHDNWYSRVKAIYVSIITPLIKELKFFQQDGMHACLMSTEQHQ